MSETHNVDQTASVDQIAIIGMAGRFPGAEDIETFWDNLYQGREGIAVLSDDDLVAAGVSPAKHAQDSFVRAKGTLDDADLFDAGFFGYSAREAQILDPQHRVFLECAWAALEAAGCVPSTFDGRIGVFAGTSINSYLLHNIIANRRLVESVGTYQTLLASDKDFLATRVAYKIGLKGPALTVQTACSTSLVAVHLACQSLLNGECDIALAGGVAVSSPLRDGYTYEPGGILSPDGHCRAFDADAGGTVPGNGVGIVVLRRLADARDHGDTVEAVIIGTAVNNDGSLKAGYTAPSVDGQADVIAEALALAGVTADTIGYVETHGTGTALGDPIEIAALTRAFRADTEEIGRCAIGSVKSNIGHLDAAAGVTSLIKTALMLKREAMVASLHFTRPNPALGLEQSPFFVTSEVRPWPRQKTPRRAGVSSFGIGGTNVHLVLEEAPPDPPSGATRPATMLALSAKTPDAVVAGAQRLADYLDTHPEVALDDVARTLVHRRTAFGQRRTVVCGSRDDAVAQLRGTRPADVGAAREKGTTVAFMFPGQGAQYVNMARDLYAHEPVFTEEVDRCAKLFAGHLGLDLRAWLSTAPEDVDAAAAKLEQTQYTQPILFLVEYALAQLWGSWGLRPAAMIGHSVGEYVAACLAGVFSLEDAVRLVSARGRLVQSMPRGAMLTVFLPEAEVAAWLSPEVNGAEVSLAAVNSTGLSVVSGPVEAIDALEQRLKAAAIACRRLHTSHAFHSASMDAAVEALVAQVQTVELNAPRIPFHSNVTGDWITDEQATSPHYWGSHLRQPVRFADSLESLLGDPSLVFVEVGPGQTLTNFVQQHRAFDSGRTVVGSLRHPNEAVDDRVHLRRSLGRLWSAGTTIDWSAVTGTGGRVLRLPTYAFDRQRYWVEPDASTPSQDQPVGRSKSVDDWFYTGGWKRLPAQGAPGEPSSPVDPLWVVLGDGIGLGRALAEHLEAGGAAVVRVGAGSDFEPRGERSWSLVADRRDHFARLLKAMAEQSPPAIRLVHLFSLGCEPAPNLDGTTAAQLDETKVDRAQRFGFGSLLALAQGIGDAGVSVPIAIDVLGRGLYAVTGDELLEPAQATLVGPATVIPQELSGITCRLLDVTGADPHEPAAQTVTAVRAVLDRPTDSGDLALRGRHWWYRDFDAVSLAPRPDGGTRLRDGGVYLITGGLGGVGLALADHIAHAVDAPVLALLGRSAFPAEPEWAGWLAAHDSSDATSARIRRLQRLRDLGAQVVLCRADVTDFSQTAGAVQGLRDRFGSLNGIIHAAGRPASAMIATLTDPDDVFAAKVRGTLVLDQVSAGDDLDLFLLCSSVTAVLGGPGQTDYCAANAFLDAFAEWKGQQGGAPVTSVAWGTWQGVGMATGVGAALRRDEPAGAPTGHPLLRLVQTTENSRTYATTFATAESWIVGDHRLMGHGLVPGTPYLELARAALADQAGERDLELHDVLFLSPVIVPDGQTRTVYTTIEQRDGRVHFAVRSRAGSSWREHTTGLASFHDRATDTVRDLAAIVDATEIIDTEAEIRRRFRTAQFEKGAGPLEFWFGPRWQVLHRVETNGQRMLAKLQLPDAFASDVDTYGLHPALLDMAGGVFRMHARDLYYLPLTYRSLRVYHPLPATTYCSVEIRNADDLAGETLTCDLELLDPDGRLLVQVVGFSVKRVNDFPALLAQIDQAVADGQADAGDNAAGEKRAAGVLGVLTEGMTEDEGQAAFGRILGAASLPAHLVVSAHDFPTLRRLAGSITPELLAHEIDQLALPTGTHPRPALDTPYVAPATEEEKAVAAVWQEVLGVEPIGLHDDFFALGGHSLAAVQISTRIQSRLGVELDVRSFFDAPTVAHIAALLASADRREGTAPDVIQAIDRDGQSTETDSDELDRIDELSDREVDALLRDLLAQEPDGEDGVR